MAAAHPHRIAPSRAGAREKCRFPRTFAPITAILLSLTDQVLQIVQAEASKNGQTYLSLNSGGGGGGVSSLAQTILQSQINIPPTFSKHQGETMALFLDQLIDFSSSYHLRTVGFKQ